MMLIPCGGIIFAIPESTPRDCITPMYANGSSNSAAVGRNTGASGSSSTALACSNSDRRMAWNVRANYKQEYLLTTSDEVFDVYEMCRHILAEKACVVLISWLGSCPGAGLQRR